MPRPFWNASRWNDSRVVTLLLTLLPTVLVVVGVTWVIGTNPELRGGFTEAWGVLMAGDPEALLDWLRGFGVWAPVVSALLQVAAAVFPPGPSFVLSMANAMLFGFVWGALLSLGTQILAALVCFGLARIIGRPGVARIFRPEKLDKMDAFMARRGVMAVFLGRIIPFINPDLVSYAAGVSAMRPLRFTLALGAGAIPSVLFYSVIGAYALEFAPGVLVLVLAASFIPLIGLFFYVRLRKERGGDETPPLG